MFQANAFQVNAFQIGDVPGIAPPFVPPADTGGPQGGLKKRRRRKPRDYDDRTYDLSEGFSGRLVPMGEDEPATVAEAVEAVEAINGEAAPDTALANALRSAIADAKDRGRQIDAEQIERLRLQLEEEELEELLLILAAM